VSYKNYIEKAANTVPPFAEAAASWTIADAFVSRYKTSTVLTRFSIIARKLFDCLLERHDSRSGSTNSAERHCDELIVEKLKR